MNISFRSLIRLFQQDEPSLDAILPHTTAVSDTLADSHCVGHNALKRARYLCRNAAVAAQHPVSLFSLRGKVKRNRCGEKISPLGVNLWGTLVTGALFPTVCFATADTNCCLTGFCSLLFWFVVVGFSNNFFGAQGSRRFGLSFWYRNMMSSYWIWPQTYTILVLVLYQNGMGFESCRSSSSWPYFHKLTILYGFEIGPNYPHTK